MTVLLGQNTTGVNGANSNSAGLAFAQQLTALASGTVDTVWIFVGTGTAVAAPHAAIYADSAGAPGSRLTPDVSGGPTTANQWYSLPISLAVVAGTKYWIAWLAPSGGNAFNYTNFAATGGTERDSTSGTLTTLPNPYSPLGSNANIANVYASAVDVQSFPEFLPRNTLGRGVRNRGQIVRFLQRVPEVVAVGPTVFTPVLAATQAQALTIQRQIARTSALTQAQIATDLQALVRSFNASQDQSPTSVDSLGRALSVVQGQAPVVVLQSGEVVAITQGQGGAIQRGLARILAPSQGQTPAQTLALSRVLAPTQSQSPSLIFLKVKFVNLTLTQGQTPTQVLQIGLPQPATQGQSSSSAESGSRSFSTTQGQSNSQALQVRRVTSATQGQTPITVLQNGQIVNTTQGQSGATTRGLSRSSSITQGQTPSQTPVVNRTLSTTQAQSASLTFIKVKLRTLTLSQDQTVTQVLRVGLPNALSQGQSPTSPQSLSRSSAVTQGQSASQALQVNRVLVTPGAYSTKILSENGLIGYWRVGEPSGTSATDLALGNTGTYHSTFTLGQPGAIPSDSDTAVTFDGSSGWLGIPGTATLNAVTDVWTFEMWVKRNRINAVSAEQLLYSRQGNGGTGSQVSVQIRTNNQIFVRAAGIADLASSSVLITDTTTPHHIVVTKSGATLRIYLDGQDVTQSLANTTLGVGTGTWGVGAQPSPNSAFLGAIVDEVAIYSTALTAAQVLSHYQIGSGQGESMVRMPIRALTGSQGQTVTQTLALQRNVGRTQTQSLTLIVTPSTGGGPPPMELNTQGSIYSISTAAKVFQLPTAGTIQAITTLGALYGTKSLAGLMPYVTLCTIFQLPTKGSLYGTSTKASIMAITTTASIMGPNTKGVIKA